ncbi:hypothetical protein [Persicobacter diffluens]|uniref:hypothetical protein n=1 Tax=Persicobacter diffluens TaxID=981 RepID=UPI0030C66B08
MHWADLVLVMEGEQRSKIRKVYAHLDLPEMGVLHIPDDYEYMDPELVELLEEGIEACMASD